MPQYGLFLFDVRGNARAMNFLAGILNDPLHGLPMIEPAVSSASQLPEPHDVMENSRSWNFFVSVHYYICEGCWTVVARNVCD